MTSPSLFANPNIGAVGTETGLHIAGDLVGLSNPKVVFWYVRSAPSASSAKTLDEYDTLAAFLTQQTTSYTGPLDLNTELSDLRLSLTPAGAKFSPDAPGEYVFEAHDVTQYRFEEHYGGHVPAAGQVRELDNELTALPGYTGLAGAGVAPVYQLDYFVSEVRSRSFGAGTDTATLTIALSNDTTLDAPGSVVLKPAGTVIAKIAATNADVIAAVQSFKAFSGLSVAAMLESQGLVQLFGAYSRHLALAATFDTHGAVDGVNGLASSSTTTLAGAIAILNDLRIKYSAHRVLTSGGVHVGADATNVVTAPACTNVQTARTLWIDLYAAIDAHVMVDTTVHVAGPTTPVDGGGRVWLEAPLAGNVAHLVQQTNALAALYARHLAKVTNAAPHAAADTDNVLVGVNFNTIESACTVLNLMADALERHAANEASPGAPAATAYHQHAGAPVFSRLKIPFRASSPITLQKTAEAIAVALEAHAAGFYSDAAGGLHGSAAWGKIGSSTFDAYLSARLAKAWHNATSVVAPKPPAYANIGGAALGLAGWT
jgi:hypothetical protein